MVLTEEQTKELFRVVHYFFPQRKLQLVSKVILMLNLISAGM